MSSMGNTSQVAILDQPTAADMLDQIAQLGPGLGIRLHAQTYLEEFYKGHGFMPFGDVYLIDGLDHIEMVRPR